MDGHLPRDPRLELESIVMIVSSFCLANRLIGVNFLVELVEQLLLLFLSSDNSVDKFWIIPDGGSDASWTNLFSLIQETKLELL